MPHRPASQALARFRVLDLTRVRAGPTCVRQLADWGADVVKIELPETPAEGQLGGPRNGSDFQNLHRNKRAMTLNLKSEAGREVFFDLVRKSDVVVENYRPDVKGRLGIDYDRVREINPRIVYASISGFGQDGPYRTRPGFDQIAQGMGGLMSITGLAGQGPVRVGIPIADLCSGLLCAQGILVALLEREASGEGQWVHTSLLEAQVFMLDFQAARWLMDGDVPKQAGNDHPTSIPTGMFKTADGYINVAVAGDVIWRRFCEAVSGMDWVEDPEFRTAKLRSTNRQRLNALIQKKLETRPSAHWIALLNDAGVPCGPVNTIDQVFADEQIRHLGIARPMVSHERGSTQVVGQAIHMSRTPSEVVAPPPRLGEHTDEILAELGYDAARIAELRERGAI
jgi:crotonobetainyl-CoA:carnitine CoA-transferase CaiB-like acyl-CoA transferase